MAKLRAIFFHFIVLVLILVLWQVFASSEDMSFFLGSPIEIISIFYENTLNGLFPYSALITGFEALMGLVIGTSIGVLLGLSSWYSSVLKLALSPYVFIASIIPVFSFAPLIIIWFGIGYGMKIALAAFASFIISYSEACYSSNEVSENEIKRLYLMKASKLDVLRIFVFPSCLNRIILSAKRNVSASLLGAFIGEFLSANLGIASEMIKAGSLYQVSCVWAASLYLIILACLMLGLVRFVEVYKNTFIRKFSVRS